MGVGQNQVWDWVDPGLDLRLTPEDVLIPLRNETCSNFHGFGPRFLYSLSAIHRLDRCCDVTAWDFVRGTRRASPGDASRSRSKRLGRTGWSVGWAKSVAVVGRW